jgi:glycosyltransferase involved in cell wall biosynthesis
MKILMISAETLGAPHGGAVHTEEMARAFSEGGHEVLLVSPGRSNTKEAFRHLPCAMRRGFSLSSDFWALSRMGEMRAFGAELLYERQLVTGGLGACLACRWKRPLVLEVNSPHRLEYLHRFPALKILNPLLCAFENWQFSKASLAVTTHDVCLPESFRGARLVGPWGVSRREEGEEGPLWPDLKERKIILFSGSFQNWHAGHRLKDILKKLPEGPWALVLLGNSENAAALCESLQSLPFPVSRRGPLAFKDMPRAYRQSRVLLAPFEKPLPGRAFYYSPFKILEALSCSLPVVTCDFDNLKILLDEDWCGSVLARDDPAAWAAALLQILQADRVDKAKGKAYAQRHSWKDHAAAIIAELETRGLLKT